MGFESRSPRGETTDSVRQVWLPGMTCAALLNSSLSPSLKILLTAQEMSGVTAKTTRRYCRFFGHPPTHLSCTCTSTAPNKMLTHGYSIENAKSSCCRGCLESLSLLRGTILLSKVYSVCFLQSSVVGFCRLYELWNHT